MTIFLKSRRRVLQAACVLPLAPAWARAAARLPLHNTVVAAPFAMPPVTSPDFSRSPRFRITDFGATPGDQRTISAALTRAITKANSLGGGVVVVPEGRWPTGAIHLKSNVNLYLEKGATLAFSDRPEDYLPAVQTSWEGVECLNYSPLVYAFGCENVAVTGEGRLEAKLDLWQVWSARPKAHMDALVRLYQMARHNVPVSKRDMAVGENHLRPHFLQFNRCRNVLVEGISIEGSPFWVIHPFLCRDVTIRGVRIHAHGHNNDGIDPEMSENVLIEDCTFDQGDDAVSVKSGRDMDAWRLARPARNIVMRNCSIINGHQLMAIGSELSGGIENVFVDNCHFVGDGRGGGDHAVPINNLLYVKTNERRGGFVRNIHLSNVSATSLAGGVLCVETDVLYQWKTLLPTYVRRLTPIESLTVSNVRVQQAKFICSINAEQDMPVRNVRLSDIAVTHVKEAPVTLHNVEAFYSDALSRGAMSPTS